ncbi:MAG: rRNA (adenine1518-N6/adenine1519-N6)-dimethyltransferase [Acidobacteriota bacterium]|jgi:16S rRNA (adenine1518-N6/adenine1519-N6)-dimethyltransferase|nr:rRNA (adenine1518-N6/adenine1519-N6)-dimethyltransferase [Acidobacteriota bacterium]
MPKKKWGQNFLRNRGAVEKIVAAIEPAPDEIVLEIGPGEGALTEKVLELGNPVVAVEIDPELFAKLQRRFGDRIEIYNEDAVEAPLPDKPYRAVGNLPYNVATPILRRVIADPLCRRAVFMLQKEVAERITAKPGSEQYGFLTLYVQLYASARSLMTLEPRSFYPAPKVRSAVVVLDPHPPQYRSERDALESLISQSFRMRRKKLVNNLIGWRDLTREGILTAIEQAGLDVHARAETMSLDDFDRLEATLP